MKRPFYFFIFLLAFMACAANSQASVCREDFARLPILANGRVKPLRVHAQETLKFITGKSKPFAEPASVTYCNLSLSFLDKTPPQEILIKFARQDTAILLGLTKNQKTAIPNLVRQKTADIQGAIVGFEIKKEKSPFADDLKLLLKRLQIYDDITSGHNFKIPIAMDHNTNKAHTNTSANSNNSNTHWISIKELVDIMPDQMGSKDALIQAMQISGTRYAQTVSDDYMLEYHYDQLGLFHWAMAAVLITLVMTFLARSHRQLTILIPLAGVFALEITAITLRVMISGRGPVTNMYETVMWVGLGSLLFATILTFVRKDKIFLAAGLTMNLFSLFMMTFASSMLDSSIQPLVPVLRDNFWLSTHVTCITISYAALSLSWLLANFYLIKTSKTGADSKEMSRIGNLCYDSIKIGVVLLALGIILGGVWADYSWGRFWGWDPKETWALIALLCYIAILHGRYAGWIPLRRFLPLVAFAYLSVIMAWFGVNYILAAGLHSYGFSTGGAIFIMSVVGLQVAILLVHLLRKPAW